MRSARQAGMARQLSSQPISSPCISPHTPLDKKPPPTYLCCPQLDMVLAKLKPVLQVAGLVALCAAIHALGIPGRLVGGLTLALSAASWGLSRGSLDRSGAAAAVVVGWITIATSMTGGLLLLTFFVASSKLTALCDHEKELDDDHKPGGNRDWTQVLSNSAVPTALLAAAAALGTAPTLGPRHLAALHAAVLGYYACCCGDTWASEIGQLSDAQPRLPWGRPVRPGTNGGVTPLGTAASAAGGLFMGAMAAVGCLVRPGRAWGWAAPTGPLWGVLLMGEWGRTEMCVVWMGWRWDLEEKGRRRRLQRGGSWSVLPHLLGA